VAEALSRVVPDSNRGIIINSPATGSTVSAKRKQSTQFVRFWYVLFRVITWTFFAVAFTVAVCQLLNPEREVYHGHCPAAEVHFKSPIRN
jgi:hypothetical protein